MASLAAEDTERVLKDLEIQRELEFIEESPLGSGAFGSVRRARSVICLWGRSALSSPEGSMLIVVTGQV